MSIINSDSVRMGASGASTGYEIDQSIRFNSADSAYVTRTPASTGDQKKWTTSFWFKRCKTGATDYLMTAGQTGTNNGVCGIYVHSDDTIHTYFDTTGANPAGSLNSRKFRDPSAWYHFIWAVDALNTVQRVWVNGEELSVDASKNPPNFAYDMNATGSGKRMSFATQAWGHATFANIYAAEIHHLDGEYITDPTTFGEYDDNGVWRPIEVTGLTYGTNGFYITGEDSADLGADYSGNGNDFTSSGLTADDQRGDTPTENYGVLSDIFKNTSNLTVSDAGTAVSVNSSALNGRAGVFFGMDTGKWYWELLPDGTFGGQAYHTAGVIQNGRLNSAVPGTAHGSGDYEWLFMDNGNKKHNNTTSATGLSTWVASDVVQFAYDADSGELWFGLNDTWEGDPSAGTGASYTGITGTVLPILAPYGGGSGQGAFDTAFEDADLTYTPPTGFSVLSTSNIPAPAITDGTAHFQTTLYTGDGNQTQTITQSENSTFNPDFIWIKNRSNAYSHNLNDAVRGYTGASPSTAADVKVLASNNKDLEGLDSVTTAIQRGFVQESTADGFIVNKGTTGSQDGYYTNANAHTYAAWQWLAGNGTATNEDGSITSTVSANVDAGFSVIGYTGNATSGATIGHGLGTAPSVVITKSRSSSSYHWYLYHESNGATKYMRLNDTSSAFTDSAAWNNTAPTSSVVTLGNSSATNHTGTMIAYAFAEVAGYSKFGSYTGNGSIDGSVVNLGFAPAFLMIKRADAGIENWQVMDRPRSPTNVMDDVIYGDTTNTEQVANTAFSTDFLSNGFKLRTAHAGRNTSAGTYVYLAFSENPFGGDGVAPATAR